MRTLNYHLNRLAGTLDSFDVPKYQAALAANIWAGTTALTTTAAVNAKAGRTSFLALAGVLNQIAGTVGLTATDAAARIP